MEAWGFIALVWLVLGVAAAAIASGKGRSGLGWFLIGFLLGPFGFLASLLVSGNQQKLDARALAAGQSKKCPFCAEVIKIEATVCRFCGKDLPAEKPVLRDLPSELLDAAEGGSFARVTRLIGEGANVNASTDQGETALILAARNGDEGMVRLLLKAGADPNAKDASGLSAIHYASRRKSPQMLELFKAAICRR